MPNDLDEQLLSFVSDGIVEEFKVVQAIVLPPYASAVLRRMIRDSDKPPNHLVAETLDTVTILDDLQLPYVRNEKDEVLRFPAPEDSFHFDEPHIRVRPDAEGAEVGIPYSIFVRTQWHADNNKISFDEYIDAAFRYCAIISYNQISVELHSDVVAMRRRVGISQHQLTQPKGAPMLPTGLGQIFSLN